MSSNRAPLSQPQPQRPVKLTRRQRLQDDIVAALGEFFGTILFLLIGLGGIQAAANSNAASLNAATQNGGSNSINTVASIEVSLFI
jgi:aquaporin rerated protein, other eukaryote